MSKNLLLERQRDIAVITLNRPQSRNALSLDLMRELLENLADIEQDRSIRVVILAAVGTAFCAGHDLGEMTNRTSDEYRHIFAICTDLMTRIQTIPQPVIAEVQGIATAAGCQLVSTCDLAVASESASFATPGVRIGLFCTTPMVALTRSIGRKRALQMLLTGDSIDADTAAQWGLVNCVVPANELRKSTRALAERISQFSPLVIETGKRAFYAQIDLGQPDAYCHAQEVMTTNASAADAQEGMIAFLQKRNPRWMGT